MGDPQDGGGLNLGLPKDNAGGIAYDKNKSGPDRMRQSR